MALEKVYELYPDLADKKIGSTGHSHGGQASFVVLQHAEAKLGADYTYGGLAMTWERLRRAAVARALGFDLRNDQVTHVHVQYEIILVHPGLDLVISAHNASEPAALWAAIRPAVVALDPQFKGDATGFCEAYGAGKYAPDLLAPRIAPSN